MQAVAGQVEGHRNLIFAPLHGYAQIRLLPGHAWPLPVAHPEPVNDRILDPLRTKVTVIDARPTAGKVNAQGAVRGQMLLPGQGMHAGIQRFSIGGGKRSQEQQDAAGGTRPQTDAISLFQRTAKAHPGARRTRLLDAQGCQFRRQHGFDTCGRSGNKIVFIHQDISSYCRVKS